MNMTRIWTLIGALLFFVRTLSACSMAPDTPPQVALDRNEFIFAATVVGYAGPATFKGVEGAVWGLHVRPTEVVYAPTAVQEVDVYRLGLGVDCSTVGYDLEGLKRAYPLDAEVVVVAWPSHDISPSRPGVSLVVSWARGNLTTVQIPAADVARRHVDYAAAFKLPMPEFQRRGYGPGTDTMQFELQKEFARLAFSSRRERIAILDRLRGYPWAPYDLIVRKHLGRWSPTGRRLIREWRASDAAR